MTAYCDIWLIPVGELDSDGCCSEWRVAQVHPKWGIVYSLPVIGEGKQP